MHFSIPDTTEMTESNGSHYTVFNVHINGVYHCSVRYKLFYNFNDQLKKEFGASILPPFPPKKLLNLSPGQLEDRRAQLERFIQIVSQNADISGSTTFNKFLLTAQQQSQCAVSEDVTLEVYLMNGHKISVNVVSTDHTDDILETVCSKIELVDDYVYYFGLFLMMKEEDSTDNTIVRKLQEFESPYISLKAANQTPSSHRIVLRKSYWDSAFDDDLIEDRVAMNLLHVQALSDVERQWVMTSQDQGQQLNNLQKRNSKREYLRYARTLKYYGYIRFALCTCDYPQPNSAVVIYAGNRELNFRIMAKGEEEKEVSFKVTRMRCWRITSVMNPPRRIPIQTARAEKCEIYLYPDDGTDNSSSNRPVYTRLELSFEYLMCKDTLQWVTVASDQAILMSMCLQGMVDELIMKKHGNSIKKPSDRTNSKRRAQSTTSPIVPPSQTNSKTQYIQPAKDSAGYKFPIRQISGSGSTYRRSVSTSSYLSSGGAMTENEVFDREDGITDNDL